MSKLLENLTIILAKLVEFTLTFFLKSQFPCQKMANFRQEKKKKKQQHCKFSLVNSGA
jgi:hypothetical protein